MKKYWLTIAAFLLSFVLTIFISPDDVVLANSNLPKNPELASSVKTNASSNNQFAALEPLMPTIDNLFKELEIPAISVRE